MTAAADRLRFAYPRSVRIGPTVLEHMRGVTSVDWGEPDADGFYTPTIHGDPDYDRKRDEAAVARYIDAHPPLDVATLAAALEHAWQPGPLMPGAPGCEEGDLRGVDSMLLVCACGIVVRIIVPGWREMVGKPSQSARVKRAAEAKP